MKRIPTSLLWLAIAQIGMALVAGSFIMVAWLKLQPCPLCIAQRTLPDRVDHDPGSGEPIFLVSKETI